MTSARYPDDPTSVAKARAFVANVLRDSSSEVRDRAVLITSELATNAVVHARSAFTVTTRLTKHEVRVQVTDTRGETPVMQQPDETALHGRGLMIVNNLSDRWGIDVRPGGTTVWFALGR